MHVLRPFLLVLCLTIVGASPLFAQSDTVRGPKFLFTETKYNFDTVSNDSALFCRFEFQNSGTEALEIYSAEPTCPCMKLDWSRGSVAVGAKGWLTVSVAPNMLEGRFNKGVFIHSNAVNFDPYLNAFQLRILGVVGEKVKQEPVKAKKRRKIR